MSNVYPIMPTAQLSSLRFPIPWLNNNLYIWIYRVDKILSQNASLKVRFLVKGRQI